MRPTPPIELTGTAARWRRGEPCPPELVAALHGVTTVLDDDVTVAESSRDWWPLALHWALAGAVAARADVVCRPRTTSEVAAIVRLCGEHLVPLTVAGGRSGVSGGAVPVFGGVLLDTTELDPAIEVDEESGLVAVGSGVFGPQLEAALADHGLSVGHFPQSFDLATVGGWVACRGAGQYSTRYGKIEHLLAGLEVVLADGRIVRTGGAPAAATGPDVTQLFCGSEGTLGIITRIWLRTHPRPPSEQRAAYSFASFPAGIEACRRLLQAGATPAVLRLYDEVESVGQERGGDGTSCTLLVLDEGHPRLVGATMEVVAEACAGATTLPTTAVDTWLGHRNDTSALQALTRKGWVVDTMEVAASWRNLPGLFHEVRTALLGVAGTKVASCHLSHSYPDGACLYFTFVARPDDAASVDETYRRLWDAAQTTALRAGANLSHHHGVGVNRSRFMGEALGEAFEVLVALKRALDPRGFLNPGKLGLPSPFGAVPWP